MRIPTAQRIYRNSNQCFYYDYSKFASAKVEFLKRKQDRSGYLYVDSFRKEILPTFRIVELRHGRLSTCVAVFVPPNRYTTRPFSQISESNECSTYKRYVLLLGLAAGLVSLGSLWLYNLFEWCSGLQTFEYLKKTHQVFNTDESESKRQFSTGNDDNFDFKQRSSNYSKKVESIVDTQVDKKYFDLRCIHYDRKLPSKSEEIFPINCITNTEIVIMNSADHGVRSHFLWTSGSMNCPHYGSGSYKICTICWLNMPDCWLHGPTWSSLNCQLGSNKLWRNTNLLGLLICLQLIYKAIYLACSSVTKQSKSTQTSPISTPNSINNEYSDCLQQLSNTPFKLGSESITASNANITPISDYPFLEHSKIEFNPSKSDQSNHLLQSKLMSSYDINFMKTSLCDNQQNNNVKSLPTSIDNVLFPSMKNESTDQNSMNNKLSDKDFIVDPTITISTDQLLSKVIEFLNPKQVDWSNSSPVKKSSSRSLIHRVHSDAVLNRKISKSCKYLAKEHDYTTRTITNPPIYHRSRFHSSSSSSASLSCLNIDDNEGFEYDDIISIYTTKDEVMRNINKNQMTIKHFNHGGNNNEDDGDDDLIDEDNEDMDNNILRQLDTLSSLLNTKSDNFFQGQSSEISSDLNKSTYITNKPDDVLISFSSPSSSPGINKHPNNLLPSSDSDAIKFTDLTQKTVVLTDELNKLGVTLDRLLYKLQANQIQLDQAEDNLDYMWYLRDNLDDNFPSNTSDCCSEFGSSDVEAEALLNDDVDLDGNGSDDNEYKGTDNDYWSSHGRMTQSSTHPNDYYPVRGVSGYLFSSHGTLDSSLYSNLKIPSENCNYHSSNLDSGLEQSVMTCSESYAHMLSPMSEKHLENSLGHHFLYNRYLSNSQVFKNYSHSLSKYSRFKKRCSYSQRKRMCSSESNHFSTNVLPDSDGFLHPDLTFENDGPLKWSESMNMN